MRHPDEMTPSRAANIRMPRGKYKNHMICEIGEMDREYLTWLAEFAGPGVIQQAACLHLNIIIARIDVAGPPRRRARSLKERGAPLRRDAPPPETTSVPGRFAT